MNLISLITLIVVLSYLWGREDINCLKMAYGSYDFGDVKKEMGEKKGFGYLVCSQW